MTKNLFVTAVILLFVNIVSAQNARLGFTAGVSMANMLEKVNGENSNGDYVYGPIAGLILDVPMQKNGSFQLGLNYIRKGTRNESGSGSSLEKVTTHLDYLEIPMNVVFKIGKTDRKFLAGGGAATAFGITGQNTYEDAGGSEETDISFGNTLEDDLKSVDFGFTVLAGYEAPKGFFVTLNYTRGINSLFVSGPDADKLLNNYFGLRIGYLMPGKGKVKK